MTQSLLRKMIRGNYYYTDKNGRKFVFFKDLSPTFEIDDDDVEELKKMGFKQMAAKKEFQKVVTLSYGTHTEEFHVLANTDEEAIEIVKEISNEIMPEDVLDDITYECRPFLVGKDDAEEIDEGSEEEKGKKKIFQGKVTVLYGSDSVKTKFYEELVSFDEILDEIEEALPNGEFKNNDVIIFDGSAYEKNTIAMIYDKDRETFKRI